MGNGSLWDMLSNAVYYVLFMWDDVWRAVLALEPDNGSHNILNFGTWRLSARLDTHLHHLFNGLCRLDNISSDTYTQTHTHIWEDKPTGGHVHRTLVYIKLFVSLPLQGSYVAVKSSLKSAQWICYMFLYEMGIYLIKSTPWITSPVMHRKNWNQIAQ